MKKFADIIINNRLLVLLTIVAITVFFGYHMLNIKVMTNFDDLLPQTHPYFKLHDEVRDTFGGANFLVIMLSVEKGDIFNTPTLEKIRYITNELEGLPGIDRYKIVSLASSKLKEQKVTSWGIEATPVMWPEVPQTREEMEELRETVYSNQAVYGTYVSLDAKKSLMFADFLEGEELDYGIIENMLEEIRAATEDSNTTISIVGSPMHLGVVANMVEIMNWIMVGTAIIIPILLFMAYKSIWAVLFVPLAGFVSGIWGIGFMSLLGYNMDPLIFVMPFLISLMAFRHSHQLYNRYYEEYIRTKDPLEAVRTIIEKMFLPGLTSIITDAFGIAVVALAPIPLLREMAVAGAFWSVVTVVVGLILTPVVLSYVPVSDKFLKHMDMERIKEKQRTGFANRFADWLGPWLVSGRGKYYVLLTVAVVLGFSYYWERHLIVGDAQVGSNLLYPSSRYNQDSMRINSNFPLINPLFIVLEGKSHKALCELPAMKDIQNLSSYMMQNSGAAGFQNLITPMMSISQKFRDDDPIWYGLPEDPETAASYLYMLKLSGDPGDMDKFIDPQIRQTNLVFFYMDKTGPTIERAISTAREYIENYAELPETSVLTGQPTGFEYRLAGGVIGVEAAINEVVASKQLQTLLVALFGVFVFCTINFRSVKCGLILMIPLIISNFMAFAYMAINNIGLSISTLPVSAAGIGMGVDYGIYLLARIREEQKKEDGISLEEAIKRGIQTYGKSIIYIAGTLVLGLLVWTLSPLKFQAQMGFFLAIILFLNCLGAVFFVPVLTLMFKPKFK